MPFNPAVPLQSDSPAIFPAQNQENMARLQTLLGADHQFNLATAANDGYHNLIHMTVQAPSGALASTGRLYVKVVGGLVQLMYMNDAGTAYQITPNDSVLNGTVNINSSTYVTISAISANSMGTVFLWRGGFMQAGTFISSGTVVNGYSYAEKFETGTAPSEIIRLGFVGEGGSGLNLTVKNVSGSSFNGIWNYRIFYRAV